jgi:hypothetical protein
MFDRPMTLPPQPNELVLDLRGLRCPQPVLRAKKALRNIPVGGTLIMECTDPLIGDRRAPFRQSNPARAERAISRWQTLLTP